MCITERKLEKKMKGNMYHRKEICIIERKYVSLKGNMYLRKEICIIERKYVSEKGNMYH
jgi:hypothetical protein